MEHTDVLFVQLFDSRLTDQISWIKYANREFIIIIFKNYVI